MTEAKKGVKKDFERQKNEYKYMKKDERLIWKIRGYIVNLEYWIVGAFSFPTAILIWIVTGDFWKGLAFYSICIFYHLSGNFRGLSLHLENILEWVFNKRV